MHRRFRRSRKPPAKAIIVSKNRSEIKELLTKVFGQTKCQVTSDGIFQVGYCENCGMEILVPLGEKTGGHLCTECYGKYEICGIELERRKKTYLRKGTPRFAFDILPTRHHPAN